MVTDDERREVAQMLRGLPGDSTYPDLIGVIADHDGWYPAYDAANRLADLIEPGESGQNLDKNRDTVQIESPAVQKAPECDRDALLELADEMGRVRSKCDFCIKMGDCDWADETICLESRIDDYARCIREACGEAGA